MTEMPMRKRAANRAGEVGLFIDVELFEEDFSHIKMGAEVQVKATTPRSLRQHKYAWALATKISEACDWLENKDDAMDFLLIEAKHFRRIYDPLRKIAILKPKQTNFSAMDGSDYTRLLNRMKYVAVTLVVPGLDESVLKAEIEAMIGPDISPEPSKRKPRASKSSPAMGQDTTRKGVQELSASSASNGDEKPAAPRRDHGRSEPRERVKS